MTISGGGGRVDHKDDVIARQQAQLAAWTAWADKLAYKEKRADTAHDVVDVLQDALEERPDAPDALASPTVTEERDEAREAARWLLPFLVNEPVHLASAVSRWPWLAD